MTRPYIVPSHSGYTAIEMVVVVSMATILIATLLVRFTPIHENIALNSTMHQLLLDIRRAQNMAVAVTRTGPVLAPARRFGMRLSSVPGSNTSYALFADGAGGTANNQYDAPGERIGSDKLLEGGIRVTSLSGGIPVLELLFYAPEGIPVFFDGSGNPIVTNVMTIVLSSPSGARTRTITVRITGQVDAQ